MKLRSEKSLQQFSRRVIRSLQALNRDELKKTLRPWLSKKQIEAVWVRRGLILELAERRIAEHGVEAVLFD